MPRNAKNLVAKDGMAIENPMEKPMMKDQLPGDSKWPFNPLVEGHLTFETVT